MDTRASVSKIRKIVTIVTIIAFLFVLAFLFYPNFFKDRLDYDVYKLTYQFLLLVVIGGAISFLFTLYIKLREEEANRKEKKEIKRNEEKNLQRKLYNDFVQAYNDGKKIRRFLRARTRMLSVNENEKAIMIKTVRYDELMKELTILQLKFESFWEEVNANQSIFSRPGDVTTLSDNLEKIEKYLNKIVGEYEDRFYSYPNQFYIDKVSFMPLNKLTILQEFIAKYKDAKQFEEQFKKAFKKVTEVLLKELTSV